MIEHILSVICLRTITDQDTGNVSFIEVIEEITVHGPLPSLPEGKTPTLQIALKIASLWRREPEDQPAKGRARLYLSMPNLDAPKEVASYSIDLSGEVRLRALGDCPQLPFKGPGLYRFIIQLQNEGEEEWKEAASIPISVKRQEAQESAPSEAEKEKEL